MPDYDFQEVFPEINKVYLVIDSSNKASIQRVVKIYDWKASILGCVDPTTAVCIEVETNERKILLCNPKALNHVRFYKIKT